MSFNPCSNEFEVLYLHPPNVNMMSAILQDKIGYSSGHKPSFNSNKVKWWVIGQKSFSIISSKSLSFLPSQGMKFCLVHRSPCKI